MSETAGQVGGHDEIALGSMLVTLVEPHRGHEVAYNRWYERDHFYAGCLLGAWTLAGRRFVATRACKDLRYPERGPITGDAANGSYVALYWIQAGHHGEWLAWARDQVMWLHANGRMFAERDHVHTQMYRHRWSASRDDDGVPPALALDHPYRGLAMIAGEVAEGVEPAAVDQWYREQHLPATLPGSPAGLCVAASPLPLEAGGPSDVPLAEGSDRRFLHLYFLDGDPLPAWTAHFAGHGAALEDSGLGRVLFVSPFLATVPGTDAYTDELW